MVVFTVFFGTTPQLNPDASSYLNFKTDSLATMMNQLRTMGYPLFLKAVEYVSPQLHVLPQIQMLTFFLAQFLFYGALVRYGFSRWSAVVCASFMMYQRWMIDWTPCVLSDTLTLSMAISAISFLLLVVEGKNSRLGWIGLVLTTFLTWFLRPAYLFMMGLIPVLGVILARMRDFTEERRTSYGRLFGKILAAAIVPLFLFCGVRWVQVGSFGVTPLGSMNLTALTIQFLNRDQLTHFEADLRPVIEAIIESRDGQGLGPPEGAKLIPMPMYNNAYLMTWRDVYYPVLRKHLKEVKGLEAPDYANLPFSEHLGELDRIGRRIALATLRIVPSLYVLYLVKSFLFAVAFTLYATGVIAVMAVVLFATHVAWLLVRRGPPGTADEASLAVRRDWEEIRTMLCISGLFYLGNLSVFLPVMSPDGRYLATASVFFPGTLGLCILEMVKRIRRISA
jgi:hypothetical protein